MSNASVEYLPILLDLLEGRLSPEAFREKFQTKLQNEQRFMPDEIFEILDRAFGDAEMYTTNPALLSSYPDYLDEEKLRARIQEAVTRLRKIVH